MASFLIRCGHRFPYDRSNHLSNHLSKGQLSFYLWILFNTIQYNKHVMRPLTPATMKISVYFDQNNYRCWVLVSNGEILHRNHNAIVWTADDCTDHACIRPVTMSADRDHAHGNTGLHFNGQHIFFQNITS